MLKNTAGKLLVYAFGSSAHANPGDPITGDAANITGNVYIDGAAANAIDDVNPTELAGGYYLFDLTAVETNGTHLAFVAASTTINILVRAKPEAVYTFPINERGKYQNGSVWIGPANNTNVVPYVDGIITNPVSTIAAAKTIADALKLRRFNIVRTGTAQLGQDMTGYIFEGGDWSLTTTGGSRDVGTSSFVNARLAGGTFAATTGTIIWKSCRFLVPVSVGPSIMENCLFRSTLTLNAAGNYDIINGTSSIAGAAAPTFALGTGAMNVGFRDWEGGINLTGISADDMITISGRMGTIDLAGATAGTVEIRGSYKAITNAAGGVTVNIAGAVQAADVATVRAVTDQMVFTKAGEVDANALSINGAEVIGDGNAIPWDGA